MKLVHLQLAHTKLVLLKLVHEVSPLAIAIGSYEVICLKLVHEVSPLAIGSYEVSLLEVSQSYFHICVYAVHFAECENIVIFFSRIRVLNFWR